MRRLLVLTLATLAVAVTTAVAAPPHAQVALRTTSLGSVVVDARGHTLYAFDQDTGGKIACSAGCTAIWLPFLTAGAPVALKGVKASLLGMTRRSNGKLQVTFARHPLYFFANDAKAGQVKGASIAHWAALSPTGARLHAKPAPAPTSTVPAPVYGGGDGGYGP